MRGCPVTEGVHVHVIVDVLVKPIRAAASTPFGMAAVAGIAVAAILVLHAIADTIIFGLEILGAIVVAIIVLAAAYVLGKHRATPPTGAWQPADTGYAISYAPALIAGIDCAHCLPIHQPSVAALRGPNNWVMPLCSNCIRPTSLHAITRGRS